MKMYCPDRSTELRHVTHGDPAFNYPATFVRRHVETGRQWDVASTFLSRRHMLELLDVWNSDGRWQYWSKS